MKLIFPQPTPPSLYVDTTLEEPQNKDGYIEAGENVSLKVATDVYLSMKSN